MATKICPNCKNDSITWCLDEEVNKDTLWYCNRCGYIAYEIEKLERNCSICNTKTELFLIVDEENFWWCTKCDKYEKIRE